MNNLRDKETLITKRADKIGVSAAKHTCVTAVMAATLVIGKLALSFVPNIEVVTTLIIVYAFVFSYDAFLAAIVFCVLDLVLYPLSLDVAVSYFIYWNFLAAAVIFLRRLGIKSEAAYIITSLVMTLIFGVLTTFMSHVFIGLPFWPTYIAGIPFYVAQLISSLVFMSIAFKPLVTCLTRVKDGLYIK